jgi:hypothetical protein
MNQVCCGCLDSWWFWIAIGFGFLIAYIIVPLPTVVYKYPTLENAGKITYVDDQGVCYKYRATQVDCTEKK